jgi:hypothetical protein
MSFLKKLALIILLVSFCVYSAPENAKNPASIVTRSYPSVFMPHEVSFFSSKIIDQRELSRAEYKIDCLESADISILMALENKKFDKAFLKIKENVQFSRLILAIKTELDRFVSREKYRKRTVSAAFFFLDSSKNILLKLDFDKKDGKKMVSVSLFSADDVQNSALMNLVAAMLCDELFVQKYWKKGFLGVVGLGLGIRLVLNLGAVSEHLKTNVFLAKKNAVDSFRRLLGNTDFGMTYLEGCKMYLDTYHPGCFGQFEDLGNGFWLATHNNYSEVGSLFIQKPQETPPLFRGNSIAQLPQITSKKSLFCISETSGDLSLIGNRDDSIEGFLLDLNLDRASNDHAIQASYFMKYSDFKKKGFWDHDYERPTDFVVQGITVYGYRIALRTQMPQISFWKR